MPDPSFVLPLVFQSALVPFAAALAALALLRMGQASAQVSAIALAAGFAAAYFAAFHAQWSPLPQQALDWLPWIALLGSAAAIAVENAGDFLARMIGRAALSLLAGGMVVWPALESVGLQKAALVMMVTALFICSAWTLMARAAERGPAPPSILAVIAGGTALTLMLDSSQAIGQSSGALASVLIAFIVFNMPRRRIVFAGAAAGTAVLLLGVLLADAYLYAGFSVGYVLLLASGLLVDPIVERFTGGRQGRSGFAAWPAAAALTAIPVLTTVGMAFKAMQEAGGY